METSGTGLFLVVKTLKYNQICQREGEFDKVQKRKILIIIFASEREDALKRKNLKKASVAYKV